MSEYEPITAELRDAMGTDHFFCDVGGLTFARNLTITQAEFDRLCDAIDAVHAALERENAELLAKLDNMGESMHDGGRITDELRAWWVRKFPVMDKELHREFTTIADRIDAEHEKAVTAAHSNGITEYGSMVAREYVKLPVDADGVPIRVGDVMEWVSPDEDFKPVMRTVDAVGEQAFFAWTKEDGGRYAQYEARAYRHHRAPTVEDVLTEFGIDWEHEDNCEDRAALLKEYAKRLTLAGDAS